jgi:drug/metabolite transporter (DMT)-like permease
MSLRRIIAIILCALGVVVLAYSGITFKTPGEPINMGPIHLETTQSHFIPPVAGAVALVGGIVLWFVGIPGRKKN